METRKEEEKLMVAVYLITYNHEKYIAQSIESVIHQQTNFKFRLFIGEDSSPDSTGKICMEYAEKYPDKITLRINKPNKLIVNSKSTYDACFNSGAKYVAMLEGDDYWSDLTKLQQQVDFLETHPDYTFCGHRTEIRNEYQNAMEPYPLPVGELRLRDTVFGPPIHTSALIYRNGLGLPRNFFSLVAGDDALACYLAARGKGYSIDAPMSVYRVSSAGTWSTLSDKETCYKMLIIQLWTIKHYPIRIKGQLKRIFDFYYWVSDYKKVFSKNYSANQKVIIIASLFMFGLPVVLNKIKLILKLKK